MKKTIGTTLGLIAAASLTMMPMPVAAQSENAATIDKDFGCSIFVFTPEGPVFAQSQSPNRVVTTSSGETIGFCNLDVVFGEVSSTFILRDFGCSIGGVPATDTMIMVTPGGTAALRCSIHSGGN